MVELLLSTGNGLAWDLDGPDELVSEYCRVEGKGDGLWAVFLFDGPVEAEVLEGLVVLVGEVDLVVGPVGSEEFYLGDLEGVWMAGCVYS